ncbi:MAG: type II toxin-antitoxin system VapC family toxin, partial [Actinobacteria bacterium]|nr:type II toxin-antitoxin system VapC family toxin [Actinomycetota bacterium]
RTSQCLLATSGTAAMARLLYDTDVLIDHLEGRRALPVCNDVAYSCVSRAELYSWAAADEDRLDAFLDPLEEIVLDREVAEQAGRIRRGIRIKLPDALIAATALVTRRELVTRNARDFRKVKGLKLASQK